MRIFGYMNINKIKISEAFKKHKPKREKMDHKERYYRSYGKFEQPIVIDYEGYLVDGYTTYILAKWFNKKYVKVKRRRV